MLTLRWGILSAGNISGQFVRDLVINNRNNDAKVNHIIVSVGCSLIKKGQDFINENEITPDSNHGLNCTVQSYDDLYKNKDVDVVYIGTPHTFHKEQVIECLNNDKHVLVEKPITVNAKDAKELFKLAQKKQKFLMEAVWTRFFPSVKLLQTHIFKQNTIGDIVRLHADFADTLDFDKIPPSSRARDINLGAGSLLDIGIYSITYARILLDDQVGENASEFATKAFLTLDPTDKVDYSTSILIKYANGKQGVLQSCNLVAPSEYFLTLEGTKGKIQMASKNPAQPKHFKITFNDKSKDPIEFEELSDYSGFIYEANAIAHDIAAGKLQNETMPWSESLLVMSIMDAARAENGLVYPQDK